MTTEHDEHEADHARRRNLSTEERLDLIERDLRSHARSLTVMTKTLNALGEGFSDKQLEQLREAVSAAFANVGLRVDDGDHVDDAREDFRFMRRLRLLWNSAAGKVGTAVLLAVVGVVFAILGTGFWGWLGSNLHK